MSKLNKYALMSAVMLTGAIGFTSCSSDDELADANPTFNGETVKTQFAINIPYAAPGTRMTAENTQNSNNFLGMTNVRLVSFDGAPASTETFSSIIPLEDISGITATTSNKVYNDVNVPVGTDYFLFYATAPMTEKFANGSIKATLDGVSAKSDIKFELETAKIADSNNESTTLLEVMDNVAKASGWSDCSEGTDMKNLYDEFIKTTAGSANNIKLVLQNLYNAVEAYKDNETYGSVVTAIRSAITKDSKFTVTGDAAPYTLTTSLTYPQNINLPDGAVKLAYDNGFKWDTGNNVTGLASTLNVDKVCYPASLYYFINTDIATSNNTNITWPTTPSAWVGASTPWYNGWGTEVNATTRTIALKKNIEYAVASMKLSVKCASGALTDKGTAANPAIYVTVPSAGFPVTGVLVGGQPTSVDWQFAPASDDAFDYTVYDKVAAGVNAKNGADEGVNYTLVLPNTKATAAKVNFAIELENNSGVEFRGADGIIPVGGKFYLVGQLDPEKKTVDDVDKPQVFMSDYETTVTATISTLENAYNNIPDLRATQMQLGLSVDLEWKDGMSFDVTIGGN